MRLTRFFGLLFLAAAFVIAGYDLLASLESETLVLSSLGEAWFRLSPNSLNLSQAVIQRYIWPALWDPAIVSLLQLPALGVALGMGVIFLIIARRRARKRYFAARKP